MAYWRKQAIKGRRFLRRNVVQKGRRRYVNNRGNVKLGKVMRDVMYIKNSLNTERKHLELDIKDSLGAGQVQRDPLGHAIAYGPARPNRNAAVIYELTLPSRGTAYNQRVGNQIKITHISARLQVERTNAQNYQATCTWKAFIFFVKDGDNAYPTATDIVELDCNGKYTPMCYANNQTYKQFIRPKMLTKAGLIKDPANTSSAGNTTFHYPKMNQALNIPVKFENNDDYACTQNRPFIMFLSDDNSVHTDTDHLDFTGKIRISYVDN